MGCKATNPDKHTSGKLYCGKHWPKNEPSIFAESILDGNVFKYLLFLVENDEKMLQFYKWISCDVGKDHEVHGWFQCQISSCRNSWERRATSCCRLSFCNEHLDLHSKLPHCNIGTMNVKERLDAIASKMGFGTPN